ncbi:Anthranilate synthase component 1 [Candidatus Gugararchaeum adminiculabundum]|nr:Anthranilate synthase component 1 [Candidatus Gugararchaeum adminiculabundum]
MMLLDGFGGWKEPVLAIGSRKNYSVDRFEGKGLAEFFDGIAKDVEKIGMPAFGYVSYDAGRSCIRLPNKAKDDLKTPEAEFFIPEKLVKINLGRGKEAENGRGKKEGRENKSEKKIGKQKMELNRSESEFCEMVSKTRERIKQGDIYQANLSVRGSVVSELEPIDYYERLRRINPSPFSFFYQSRNVAIASSSPELLLEREGRKLVTRPIAGTRPRGKNAGEDAALRKQLTGSVKENAEHVMLVDLERNDLGRVSKFGSVKVSEMMAVEKYSHVQHLVSNVVGELQEGKTFGNVMESVFPGGTITGAPKIASMEVIEELEPVRRGAYTGSAGIIGPDFAQFNIIIRSIIFDRGKAYAQAGAGIVKDSNPQREWKESLQKMEAMKQALGC